MFRLAQRMGVLFALVLLAGPAWAIVPDLSGSTIVGIQLTPDEPPEALMADIGGDAIQHHTPLHMNIVIRDAFSNPIPGLVVRVEFGGCCGSGGMFFTDNQPGIHGPTGVYSAAGKFFEGCTNNNGRLDYGTGMGQKFWVRGNSLNFPLGSNSPVVTRCAILRVYNFGAGGACTKGTEAFNTPINIAAADQDQANGINAADGSRFVADRDLPSSNKLQARSDFNGSGAVNPADGSIMLTYVLPQKFFSSAGPPYSSCP